MTNGTRRKEGRPIALVTGATSGIGAEFCRQLDRQDDVGEIWVVARRADRLTMLAQACEKPVRTFPADLTEEGSLDALAAALTESDVSIRYLINSAGYGKLGAFDSISEADNLGIIDLNITSVVRLTQRTLPFMERGGYIINIASVSAFLPQPNFAVYAASKSFILNWSRALGQERRLREAGITVTAVCPNPIETEFFAIAGEDDPRQSSSFKSIGTEQVETVVSKALRRAHRGGDISVSHWSAQLIRFVSRVLPHRFVMRVERRLLRMYP